MESCGTFIENRRCPGVEVGARCLGRRGAVRSKHLLTRTMRSRCRGFLSCSKRSIGSAVIGDRSKRQATRTSRARGFLFLRSTPLATVPRTLVDHPEFSPSLSTSSSLSVSPREHSRTLSNSLRRIGSDSPDAHTRCNWRSFRTSEVRYGIIIYSAHTYARDDTRGGPRNGGARECTFHARTDERTDEPFGDAV